jgi:hypothetical protein
VDERVPRVLALVDELPLKLLPESNEEELQLALLLPLLLPLLPLVKLVRWLEEESLPAGSYHLVY